MNEKIIKKLTDKKFAKKIIELKSREEVKKIFESEGIEISDKEINELADSLYLIVKKTSELPSEDLAKISGGGIFDSWSFSRPATVMDVAYKGVSQPGAVAAGINSFGVVVGGFFNYLASRNKNITPQPTPPQSQPVVSNEALAIGAVVVAAAGSVYGLKKLVESGWFSKQTNTSAEK